MGNYRFRFSSMIPKTWFCKAKNSARTRTPDPSHGTINQQRTLDHTRPRKSFKIRAKKIIIFACVGRSLHATTTPPNATPKLCTPPRSSPTVRLHQLHMPDFDQFNSTNGIVSNESLEELAIILSPQSCEASSSTTDLIRDMDKKPAKEKAFKKTRPSTRASGVKLKLNSPSSSSLSKSISDSTAIVKSSFDLQKDFRESMVEMILENNIDTPRNLGQLLTCYLFLNSEEHHDLIIKVFQQICTELRGFHFY